MNNNQTRVLITAIGTMNCTTIISELKKAEEVFYVIGADINGKYSIANSNEVDEFFQFPSVLHDREGYVQYLLNFCKEHNVEVFFCVVDEEVEVVAKHKEDFNAIGITLCLANIDAIITCHNKNLFAEWSEKNIAKYCIKRYENITDVTSTESSISNCFVAIIKDGNVLSSYWYATSDLQTSSESFTTDIKRHMIVKVPSDKPALTAYAVANLTQTTADKLLTCTTIAGIRDVELAEHPNFLVKVGEQPIGAYETTTQLATHDDGNCNKITIPVSQRVAAFELASFKVVDTSKEKVGGGYPVVPNVEVVSVQMLNIKLSAKVVGEYGSSFSGVDDNILKPTDVNQSDPKKDIYGTYDKIRFYGYDNTDTDRQTSMKITYKVDGAVMDRTYPIKTKPGDAVKVVGGNLYKLSVTIGNASEDIDFVIEDWIPNTLSVGDIFGEPVK